MFNQVIAILYCYLLSALFFVAVALMVKTQGIDIPVSKQLTYIGWGAVAICFLSILSITI